jgi:hypothetical protein
MENAIVRSEMSAVMSVKEHKEQIQTIQRLMKDVMKEHNPDKGIEGHYGVVPGCGTKKVLLKAGAEKILATFRIGVDTEVTDLSTPDERRYRIKTIGRSMITGSLISTGIGECSTEEKKFKWREAVCKEEFDATDESRRQILWKKGFKSNQVQEILQVRTNPADLANTVLKLASKRSKVDLCLNATACSDIFTQDLDEDHPTVPTTPPAQQNNPPPATSQGAKVEGKKAVHPITEKQLNRMFAILARSKTTREMLDQHLAEQYQVTDPKQIEMNDYNTIVDWIEGRLA